MLVTENKKGFKTIETNYEEQKVQQDERQKTLVKRVVEIIAAVLVLVITIEIIYALRSFDSYEVRNTIERGSGSVTQYEVYGDYLLEYSNDGIACMNQTEMKWNQSFEMVSPQLEVCGEYLAVYDAGGTEIFVFTEAGLQKEFEMTSPIQTVCIAKQGTTAVLMKEDEKSQVKLFDVKGNELANGVFYEKQAAFPIDIALSYDATKLAVDMIDVSKGDVSTTIVFYNFGTVGQSEIDNHVGTYTFDGLLVPEIDYVSESKMVGMGTGKLLVFDGAQKPELSQEIIIEEEILSYFHNDSYVGIVYDDIKEGYCHIKVMDFKGRIIMENDISITYNSIEFLENNEICVRGDYACELFTTHSIKKFSYTFDKEVYKILSGENGENYTFIFRDTIEEVRLK